MFGNLFGKKQPTKVRKNPVIAGEAQRYKNGGGKPSGQTAYETWLQQISMLRNAVSTTAELASSAQLKFYKEDTKGKRTVFANPKMFDKDFMNDKDDLSSFLYNYFGAIKMYDNVLIIPEQSKYKPRAGKVDFFIIDNQRWSINPNETGSQTVKDITYKSSQGTETKFAYEDIILITKPLTSNNVLYGISRLVSLNNEIERIISMGDYLDNYIASGAKKSVIVGTDDFLSPKQEDDIRDTLNKFLSDPNQKVVLLNSEKLSVNEVSENLGSLDVANFMVKLNKRVLEGYNLPKFLLGDYEGVSNAELVRLSMRVFFETALKPEFLRLQRHLTRYARDVLNIKNILLEFDFEGISILEDSITEKLDKAERLNMLGAYSLNEVRVAVGDSAIENPNFDLHFAPAYLTSGTPVTIENLEQDISRKLSSTQTPNNDTVSGAGGTSNTEGLNGAV